MPINAKYMLLQTEDVDTTEWLFLIRLTLFLYNAKYPDSVDQPYKKKFSIK